MLGRDHKPQNPLEPDLFTPREIAAEAVILNISRLSSFFLLTEFIGYFQVKILCAYQ